LQDKEYKMKKQVEKTIYCCDECGKEIGEYSQYKCLGCGKTYCYDCAKKLGTQYPFAVVFQGSADGYFCKQCDAHPPDKVYKLHTAYLKIALLRDEVKKWHEDFERRSRKVEEYIERERRNFGL